MAATPTSYAGFAPGSVGPHNSCDLAPARGSIPVTRLALALLLVPALAHGEPMFAVVAKGTALHTAADPGSRSVAARGRWVLRAVGEPHHGWIELASDPHIANAPTGKLATDGTRHCYAHPNGSGLALHFFVRADQLLPVTTRAVKLEYKDHTSIELMPGVAVGMRDKHGDRRVALANARVAVRLPEDAISTTYRGVTQLMPFRYNSAAYIEGPATITIDERRRRLALTGGITEFAETEEYAGKTFGTLENACVRLHAELRTPTQRSGDPGGDAFGIGTVSSPTWTKVGATAYWATGAVAGTVIESTPLGDDVKTKLADRSCYSVSVDGPSGTLEYAAKTPRITVCFATSDLVGAPKPPPRGR